jgi:hypothetical protein
MVSESVFAAHFPVKLPTSGPVALFRSSLAVDGQAGSNPKVRVADHSSAVVRPATHDDPIDYQGTCTIALELGSRELQVQGIDLLETRVMQQQGRIVRGQPRPLTELPFRHSTGETHDPNTF